MDVVNRISVPTGDILVVDGKHGKLELLSIGDYGKEKNLKADFLGLTREIHGVPHGELLPLEEKWVITISSQYGCSMGCPYCDVPAVGPGKNATFSDMVSQVLTGVHLHPEVKRTDRLNIHFARMGEPSWNPWVLEVAGWMKRHLEPGDDGGVRYKIHPVVSTMMPRNNQWLKTFIHAWMRIKNRLYGGNAGLQISLNSTDEEQRRFLFNDNALSIYGIAEVMDGVIPFGRKITLNVILSDDTILDPDHLLAYFSPEHYIVKLTPVHETASAAENGIHTGSGYELYTPYRQIESDLKEAGYDVIVFIPSPEEDAGMITCGNAVLSGREPMVAS